MKILALAFVLAFAAMPVKSEQPQLSLREHMRAMGYQLDEIFARSQEPLKYSEAAVKTRELRGQLVKAIALIPSKFETLREREKNAAIAEYHQFTARVIYLSATLEQTFLLPDDLQTASGSREKDIRNLLHEINVVVGKAHSKFRD